MQKGYPRKAKTYDDLATLPSHLTETVDGEKFLNSTVIPDNNLQMPREFWYS
jgi:hypothetical protein